MLKDWPEQLRLTQHMLSRCWRTSVQSLSHCYKQACKDPAVHRGCCCQVQLLHAQHAGYPALAQSQLPEAESVMRDRHGQLTQHPLSRCWCTLVQALSASAWTLPFTVAAALCSHCVRCTRHGCWCLSSFTGTVSGA